MIKFKSSFFLLVITFFFSTHFVCAEEYHHKGYSEDLYRVTNDVTEEQHFKHFMLDFLYIEIIKAAQNKYNDKSINGLSFDWENTYNVVEINEPRTQDNSREYTYIVSVTVIPHNGDITKRKFYGPDKLTFGIEPNLIGRNIKDQPAIKLISYQHLKSSKSS
jgi:hypothetical protein